MPAAALIPAAIGGVTSIIGGIQGASAAHNAADAQKAAALQAGQTVQNAVGQANPLIGDAASGAGAGVSAAAGAGGQMVSNAAGQGQAGVSNALGDGQTGVYQGLGASGGTLNPFISTGQSSAGNLASMLAPGGSLTQTFDASKMEQYDPGYQFRIDQGSKALQRAAAARGSALGGGTLTALSNYNQNAASAEYGNAFNRFQQQQQQQYGMQLGAAQLGVNPAMQLSSQDVQTGEYNAGLGMNASQFNAGLGYNAAQYGAGLGMGAAQYGGDAAQRAAALQSGNIMGGAQYAGNAIMGAGNAQASGDIGAANAWSGMLGGIGKAASTFGTLNAMQGFGGGGIVGGMPSGYSQPSAAPPINPFYSYGAVPPAPGVSPYPG